MTPDEAMQAVKKAARMAQWMDGAKHACGNPLSVAEWETLQIALRAIAPGGPLVVVERDRLERMKRFTIDPAPTVMSDRGVLDWVNAQVRAMIAEGEKS